MSVPCGSQKPVPRPPGRGTGFLSIREERFPSIVFSTEAGGGDRPESMAFLSDLPESLFPTAWLQRPADASQTAVPFDRRAAAEGDSGRSFVGAAPVSVPLPHAFPRLSDPNGKDPDSVCAGAGRTASDIVAGKSRPFLYTRRKVCYNGHSPICY